MKKIRIKSITDVITNSSSEAYTYVDDDSINKVKELINAIIQVVEGKGTCDGYFDVRFGYSDKDWLKECWRDDHYDENREPTEEELYEYGKIKLEQTLDYCEGRPEFDHIEVIAKCPEHEELAKKITENLATYFKNGVFLC